VTVASWPARAGVIMIGLAASAPCWVMLTTQINAISTQLRMTKPRSRECFSLTPAHFSSRASSRGSSA
jgi:hypothetical protein